MKVTRADSERLHRMQDKLEALMSETRMLRERLELLIHVHKLALRDQRLTRRRGRPQDLSHAHRLF